jgi:hypothetical protein
MKDDLRIDTERLTHKVEGKFVPVLNQATRHEGVLGVYRYNSTHS